MFKKRKNEHKLSIVLNGVAQIIFVVIKNCMKESSPKYGIKYSFKFSPLNHSLWNVKNYAKIARS